MRHLSLGLLGLVGCSALLACHRTQASPTPPVAAVDAAPTVAHFEAVDARQLSASAGTEAQTEPSLAITPSGEVLIAWMEQRAGTSTTLGIRFSPDEGKTWGPVETLASPDGRSATQPVVVADGKGNIFVAWVATGRDGPGGVADSHVYVARREGGSGKFGEPVEVSTDMRRGSRFGAPWMTISGTGAALVAWTYQQAMGDGIAVARSEDGVTWARSIVIERVGLQARFPYLCASHQGPSAWVTYLDGDVGVRIRASDDGGLSWSPARVATVSVADEKPRVVNDITPCVGDGDEVTVAYGRARGNDAGAGAATVADSLVLAKSFDGGRTFDARRILDLGPTSALHPQMAREADGPIDLAFYASASDPDAGSLRWMRAADNLSPLGGARVARDKVRFDAKPQGRAWPGGYFGWQWRDGALYAALADATDDNLPHIAFTRVTTP
ncbi:MAG TPA: sialidase family protein [Polyangiaceae bacterium]|jgi:hypothetical protein